MKEPAIKFNGGENMKNRIDELIEEICESEELTSVQVLEKYPDLAKIKHEEELREKAEQNEKKDKRRLLKG
jgi:2-oxo-4-hydroxy-4-carboxy--5-ureidoimidazoline (OHCU) decarboxylase